MDADSRYNVMLKYWQAEVDTLKEKLVEAESRYNVMMKHFQVEVEKSHEQLAERDEVRSSASNSSRSISSIRATSSCCSCCSVLVTWPSATLRSLSLVRFQQTRRHVC